MGFCAGAERFSAAAGFLGEAGGLAGFSGSLCSMFFKPLRIDFEGFLAMCALERIVRRHSITTIRAAALGVNP